jgi:hypothetical protein
VVVSDNVEVVEVEAEAETKAEATVRVASWPDAWATSSPSCTGT